MTRKERRALRKRMTWLRRTRRPPAVWLQVPVILAFLVFLWWELPHANRPAPRRNPARPPHSAVAFVNLPDGLARKLLRGARTFWTTDRGKAGMDAFDIARLDLDAALPPHRAFTSPNDYPGAWKPAPVGRLPTTAPLAVPPSTTAELEDEAPLPPMPSGIHVEMDADLRSAQFTYPAPNPATFDVVSGEVRFHVETGTDGEPETVLLLSPRTPVSAGLEALLRQGRATRRSRGDLTIQWNTAP